MKVVNNYTIVGFISGIAFIVAAVLIEMFSGGFGFSPSGIADIFDNSKSLFVVCVAPLVLGFAGYYISTLIEKQSVISKTSQDKENLLRENMLKYSASLIEGKYDHDISFRNEVLDESLKKLTDHLVKTREDEKKRQEEDRQRNWATEGLAMFSEILRKNNNDLDALSKEIIGSLINYMEMVQGGIFVVDEVDDEVVFNLTACYAYDRHKFTEKVIKSNEGLIGACYLEKDTIYMTDVPEDYVNITSGLGGSNPCCILIVPFKVNEEVFGVVELAGFKELTQYQIEFMEKLGESIASSIQNAKTNMQTIKLLDESKMQSEQLQSQDEEMRQNMEEMIATQEELQRKEKELEANVRKLETIKNDLQRDFDAKESELVENQRLIENQMFDLEDAMRKARKHEKELIKKESELQETIHELKAQEEELTQNLEEIQALNETVELTNKEKAIFEEEAKKQMMDQMFALEDRVMSMKKKHKKEMALLKAELEESKG